MNSPTVKPLHPAMRWMLRATGVLVFAAGLDLFVFAEFTDNMFAWQIEPPLTAAFLGANYLAAGVVEFGAARELTWSRARAAVPAVLLFTALTAVLTFVNLAGYDLRKPMAWVWLAVYFGVPPLLALAPHWESTLWPWMLSASASGYGSSSGMGMAAYVGVWLLSWGVLLVHAVVERDLMRVRYVFVALVALAVLQSLALARFRTSVIWMTPAAVYLAVLAVLGAVGVRGWLVSERVKGATMPAQRTHVR